MALLAFTIAFLLMAGDAFAQTANPIHSAPPRLTETQIRNAIRAGESRKFGHLTSDCSATAGFGESFAAGVAGGVNRTGSYRVTFSTNLGRIAFMAAQAKRLYQPLTVQNVPDDLLEAKVIVFIEPDEPVHSRQLGTLDVAAPIEHVVLKSKPRPDAVIQPTKIDTERVEWANLFGGKVDANRAVAFFDHQAVRELPAGDFDVVIITPNGERRCKVGNNDRMRVLSPAK